MQSATGNARCGLRFPGVPATLHRPEAERETNMGDKSPKSKQRDQKKRDAAVAKHTAAAREKQDAQSRYQQLGTKGKN